MVGCNVGVNESVSAYMHVDLTNPNDLCLKPVVLHVLDSKNFKVIPLLWSCITLIIYNVVFKAIYTIPKTCPYRDCFQLEKMKIS